VARRRAARAAAPGIVAPVASGNAVHASPPADPGGSWSASAFGLAVRGPLRLESLVSAPTAGEPEARVERASRGALDARWRAACARPLLERRVAGGGIGLTVQHDTGAGYRVWAPRHGVWIVTPDGRAVTGAPPSGPRWRWERLVLAQALPLAAVLQGMEVLHASAVCVDGRALAFIGPSGAGKTTLATRLLARGARLVTDDVLAVTTEGATVWGHRGGAVARIDADTLRGMTRAERAALGPVEARGAKWHVRPPTGPARVPLGALYVLGGGARDSRVTVRPLHPVDPGLLLGSAFLPYLDARDRLRRQLDVVAAIAAGVPAYAVDAGRRAGPAAAADAVLEHSRDVLAGAPA
jgi:hypothetical protein